MHWLRTLTISWLMIVALVLVGCGAPAPATGDAGSPAPATGGAVELTFWTAFPEWQKFVEEAAAIYQQDHPGVKVTVTLFPQRALEEKVAVTLPAGEGPDLLELDKMGIYPYYDQQYIEPLDQASVDFIQKNYPQWAIDSVTAPDGNLFAYPWSVSTKVMYYNKDYFAEAGLTEPPQTVEQMLEYARKLTTYDNAGNITRAGLDLRLSGGAFGTSQKYWAQALIPYGVEVLEPSGDTYRAAYDTQAGYDALKLYIDAVHKYHVDSLNFKSDSEAFGQGLTAMFQRESWVVPYLAEHAPELNYGVFLMPKGPGGEGTVGNMMSLAVPKDSQHKPEAFAFARFLMSDEMSRLMFTSSGWQPSRTNVDYTDVYATYPMMKTFVDSLATDGYQVLDYENIAPIAEIHNRLADRLIVAFKRADLVDNPDGIAKEVAAMAQETNDILSRADLLTH